MTLRCDEEGEEGSNSSQQSTDRSGFLTTTSVSASDIYVYYILFLLSSA